MTSEHARALVASDVSRETLTKLDLYVDELRKWQRSINLVARSTLDVAWARHILDSLQIFALRPGNTGHWLDIGSGGGFPGMVCAIAAQDTAPDLQFSFLESDVRKCAFLREVARKTDVPATIIGQRIEAADPQAADIVSARALAPLEKLCTLSFPHVKPTGTLLFLKGKNHKDEQSAMDRNWRMKREIFPSKTDAEAVIYRIEELARV